MKKLILMLFLLITVSIVAQTNLPTPVYTCMGITKAGNACKMKVDKPGGYCRFHNPNAIHCAGTKKDGTPCKMQVTKQGDYCHYHSPIK